MADPTIGLNQKQVDPNLSDLLKLWKKDIFLNLNCHAIATIQSFNAEKQTVEATINYKKTYFQKDASGVTQPVQRDYPLLLDVPVVIMTGGNSHLTFPISKGDTCLILFNDRDIDNWVQSGQIKPLSSSRLHSLADGIALIGIRSAANVIESYDQDRARLQKGEAYVGVGKDDKYIKLANEDQDLKSLLNQLINAVKDLVSATSSITVTCAGSGFPSSPPINAAAITAVTATLTGVATDIAELLE